MLMSASGRMEKELYETTTTDPKRTSTMKAALNFILLVSLSIMCLIHIRYPNMTFCGKKWRS